MYFKDKDSNINIKIDQVEKIFNDLRSRLVFMNKEIDNIGNDSFLKNIDVENENIKNTPKTLIENCSNENCGCHMNNCDNLYDTNHNLKHIICDQNKLETDDLTKKKLDTLYVFIDELSMKLKQLESEIVQRNQEIVNLKEENENNDLQHKYVIESFKSENNKYLEEIKIKNENYMKELNEMKNLLKNKENEIQIKQQKILDLQENKSVLELKLKNLEKMEEKIEIFKMKERKLIEEIIDLKGAIRVFCRIRPKFYKNTDSKNYEIEYSDDKITIKEKIESSYNNFNIKTHNFLFDKVFGPECDQLQVYDEISFLIRSILDGYKVCIFAYGQTGSGKTYTMDGIEDNPGIIPRSVSEIFEVSKELSKNNWKFEFIISFVEIYNENIVDLLENNTKKCDIRHENDETYITNCTYKVIETLEDFTRHFKNALENRTTGVTFVNERSSRSHSIFTLKINLCNSVTNQKRQGILNLIDLAGSERLSESKCEKIRLVETQNINKSLACLGNVINSLIKKDSHIAFRDSKLTYLLKNNFLGKSRTIMIVNVSPDWMHLNETICSLRFSSNVKQCRLGKATSNVHKNV
ncbi:kinesin motor domain-containing protein [Hamiltosporidium magnivora]|uniref:Kinesin motor domain-containing protein n=1 Tax=Hamiltosporidium magnivora TaxID=148818 RepID=A0A4Q9LKL9_9MICR|nr:kinesin motor domain-containing protein [Hamiltosporidium magnivora]